MTKLRPEQLLPPAKKLTKEVLRENPLLGVLARQRLKEARGNLSEKEQLELHSNYFRNLPPPELRNHARRRASPASFERTTHATGRRGG